MEWFKKHADLLIILSTFASAMVWNNSQFDKINEKITQSNIQINERFSSLEKDMAIIKTVLVMKDIMPRELVKNSKE